MYRFLLFLIMPFTLYCQVLIDYLDIAIPAETSVPKYKSYSVQIHTGLLNVDEGYGQAGGRIGIVDFPFAQNGRMKYLETNLSIQYHPVINSIVAVKLPIQLMASLEYEFLFNNQIQNIDLDGSEGLGDIEIGYKYLLAKKPGERQVFSADIILPTGETIDDNSDIAFGSGMGATRLRIGWAGNFLHYQPIGLRNSVILNYEYFFPESKEDEDDTWTEIQGDVFNIGLGYSYLLDKFSTGWPVDLGLGLDWAYQYRSNDIIAGEEQAFTRGFGGVIRPKIGLGYRSDKLGTLTFNLSKDFSTHGRNIMADQFLSFDISYKPNLEKPSGLLLRATDRSILQDKYASVDRKKKKKEKANQKRTTSRSFTRTEKQDSQHPIFRLKKNSAGNAPTFQYEYYSYSYINTESYPDSIFSVRTLDLTIKEDVFEAYASANADSIDWQSALGVTGYTFVPQRQFALSIGNLTPFQISGEPVSEADSSYKSNVDLSWGFNDKMGIGICLTSAPPMFYYVSDSVAVVSGLPLNEDKLLFRTWYRSRHSEKLRSVVELTYQASMGHMSETSSLVGSAAHQLEFGIKGGVDYLVMKNTFASAQAGFAFSPEGEYQERFQFSEMGVEFDTTISVGANPGNEFLLSTQIVRSGKVRSYQRMLTVIPSLGIEMQLRARGSEAFDGQDIPNSDGYLVTITPKIGLFGEIKRFRSLPLRVKMGYTIPISYDRYPAISGAQIEIIMRGSLKSFFTQILEMTE
ncbi:MAG: transporter [Candidatus Marinimicrobia bacterium]|nr:transporter [Candidatus Neomarinimicrobiota bacterium]